MMKFAVGTDKVTAVNGLALSAALNPPGSPGRTFDNPHRGVVHRERRLEGKPVGVLAVMVLGGWPRPVPG